jgi:hypothetical protein
MTEVTWTAWYRAGPGRPWVRIGEAASAEEAWRVALAYELSGDKTICRPGTDPNPAAAPAKGGQQRTLFDS